MYLFSFFIFSIFIIVSQCTDIDVTTNVPKLNCRDKNRLITSDKYDRYTLVEVYLNETFILECHFCSEYDNDAPKIWYKIDTITNVANEVEFGMESNSSLSKISLAQDHSLIIKEATIEDAGIYYCQSINDDEIDLNFIVDVIFGNLHTEKGSLFEWSKYHDDYFMPINKLFITSNESDFQFIRNIMKLDLELVTEWGPWNSCEVCGRPSGQGIQESVGYCRIKVQNLLENTHGSQYETVAGKLLYFLKTAQVSCTSYLFQELFPEVSNITGELPNFIQTRHCEGICGLETKGLGWKASKGYKFRKMFVLAEKAHLTVVCPEATLDNVVIWRRNGKVLERGKYIISKDNLNEPHVMVDSFGTLYLVDVTIYDEGNYTCQVDDIKMQQVRIMIVSKTVIITRAFLRHMGYLGIALSLTSFCYCAGLFLAWRRRHTFKTYEECIEEDRRKSDRESKWYETDLKSSEVKDGKTDDSGTDTESTKEQNIDKKKGKRERKRKTKIDNVISSTESETDDRTHLLKEGKKESRSKRIENVPIKVKPKIKNKSKVKQHFSDSSETDSKISTEKQLLLPSKDGSKSTFKMKRKQNKSKGSTVNSGSSDDKLLLLLQESKEKPRSKKESSKKSKASTSADTTESAKTDTETSVEQLLLKRKKEESKKKGKTKSTSSKSEDTTETNSDSGTVEELRMLLAKRKSKNLKSASKVPVAKKNGNTSTKNDTSEE